MEGHGSNDAMILGLNLYGTSKRAVTYFTKALAKELEERKSKVKAGRLSPGIMITDFTVKALGGEQKNEYVRGHIPGAVNEPLSSIDRTTLPKDRPLFLYCLRGSRSKKAAGILKKLGYGQVKNIGGITGYHGDLER